MPKPEEWLEAARTSERNGDFVAAAGQYARFVEADPVRLDGWLRLSELQEYLGRYSNSSTSARRAAHLLKSTGNWGWLSRVSMRLLRFDELGLIHELILAADWSSTEVLTQSAVLSQHLWLTGHHADALRLLDAVEPRVKPSHLLAYSRALALRNEGRLREATAQFERCLSLAPDYPFAHWSLAYHEKSLPRGARVERVVRAKAASDPESIERVHLGFALFKEFDDADETERAWAELSEACALMAKLVPFDRAAERHRIDALMGRPPAAPAAQRAPSSPFTPVFVVGMPRTGTTLVERILSNHAAVATAGELNDFAQAVSLATDHFISGTPDQADLDRLDAAAFAGVGEEYLRRTARLAEGHRVLVDKNPANFFHAESIRRALPQARIICLTRNPMDACFSNMKELFAGGAYPYSYDQVDLASHYMNFDRLRMHWEAVLDGAFMSIAYEELVTDTENVARRMADFCGIEFAIDSVDITRNASPVATASSSQVRQPVHAGNIDGWKRYASHLHPLHYALSLTGHVL